MPLAVYGGAVVGATHGVLNSGVLGLVAGFFLGGVLGFVVLVAFMIGLTLLIFLVCGAGAFLKGGRKGLRQFWREAFGPAPEPPPPAPPTSVGETHGDG